MPLNKALMSAKVTDWRTPPEILDRVRCIAPIGLDPCGHALAPDLAKTVWYEHGLEKSWDGHGLIFVNPPYGRAIVDWVSYASNIYVETSTSEIVLLVPARTDTRWFQLFVTTASSICFLRGRVKFIGCSGKTDPAPFPSCVAYWGYRPERFRRAFRDAGWIVDYPWRAL